MTRRLCARNLTELKPRTVHLAVLGVVCLVPLVVGSFLVISGTRSHSTYSGIAQAAGAACLFAVAGYAAVTSLVVWKWGSSPKRVLVIHACVLGLGALCVLTPRLAFFLS